MIAKFQCFLKGKSTRKYLSSFLRNINRFLISFLDFLVNIAKFIEILHCALFDFDYRPNDIFIVSYPRSGNTWMQMILYQLTTDGDLNFDHISQVCPWIERTIFFKKILKNKYLESLSSPRIFKTHLHYNYFMNADCKFIYIIRNPMDVAVSYYNLYKSHLKFEGTFEDFFFINFIPGKVKYGSWFEHVANWWNNKSNKNVLFITYEELLSDLESSIKKISNFCEINLDNQEIPELLNKCSFDFMKKNEQKFDHKSEIIWESYNKVLHMKNSSFIRSGKSGQRKQYSNNKKKNAIIIKNKKYFHNSFNDFIKSKPSSNFYIF